MPIYVYECEQCEQRFEYRQSISEAPKTVCESCSGKLNKVIVPIAFHLKGGGWYKDLYSSSKPAGGGDQKPDAGTKAESKPAETKTETKAEAKKDSGGDK